MNKKAIVASIFLIVTGVAFWYFKYVYGWQTFRYNSDTPAEFLSNVKVNHARYYEDSIKLIANLNEELHLRKNFFEGGGYTDSTKLIIDTIVYSPFYNKMAVLVIAQTPPSNEVSRNKNYNYYFDATGYISLRRSDSLLLKWVGPNFTQGNDKAAISHYLRGTSFRAFAKPDSKESFYNMNDKRFWTSVIWNSIEQ